MTERPTPDEPDGDEPRLLGDTAALAAALGEPRSGAVWRLTPEPRDLDANVVALPPHGQIAEHVGPDLDVLVHVIAGSGEATSGEARLPLRPGTLMWLPRGARRGIRADATGLRYLTVHRHKHGLMPRLQR